MDPNCYRTLFAVALLCASCADGPLSQPPPPPPVNRVEVIPAAVSLTPGETYRFQARVVGPGSVSQAVSWSIDTWPNGNARSGWIDADGTYHAPEVVTATRVSVRATSEVDRSKSAIGTVDLPARTITITPEHAEVMTDDTVQFTVALTGVFDTAVRWSNTPACGTIDENGLFRAPHLVYPSPCTVRVESIASWDQANASVVILARPTVLSGTSGAAAPGEVVTIYATDFSGYGLVVFSPQAGEPVLAEARPAPAGIEVTVPAGAASGPVYVLERKASTWSPSNAVVFTRAPRLRLVPDRRDLSAGESTRLRIAFLGAGPLPVTYDADVGTIVGEEYFAPAVVTDTVFATIRVCLTGTTNCTGTRLGIHPFRVTPDEPLAAPGESLTLAALVAGQPVPASFVLEAGGGALTSEGQYTAAAGLADQGPVWIRADQGASAADVQVGVGGLVPGLVNRIFDYVDHRTNGDWGNVRWGASADAIAISGSRLFVAAGHPEYRTCIPGMCWPAPNDVPAYYWIDVYDLADPVHPSWLGAVESATCPQGMFTVGDKLYLWSDADPSAGAWVEHIHFFMTGVPSMALYDLSGDLPLVVRRAVYRPDPSQSGVHKVRASHDDTRVYDFLPIPYPPDRIPVAVYTAADDPGTPPRFTTLVAPSDCRFNEIVTASENRAYAGIDCYVAGIGGGQYQKILAWDLASDPPTLLGGIDGTYMGRLDAGHGLLFSNHAGFSSVFDCSAGVPSLLGELPVGNDTPLYFAPDGRVLVMGQDGLHEWATGGVIVDPLHAGGPRATASFYSGQHARGGAVFSAGFVYAAEGTGGVAVYDLTSPGGLAPLRKFLSPSFACGWEVYSAAALGAYLYAAGVWACDYAEGSFLALWDISPGSRGRTSPLWEDVRSPFPEAMPLAIAGTRLLVGTPDGLEVWSLDDPATPAPVSFVSLPVRSLAVDGTVVWAGTYDGRVVAIDLASQSGPAVVGAVALGDSISAIRVIVPGRLAVALSGKTSGDLVLVDGSAPTAPVELGRGLLGLQVLDADAAHDVAVLATPAGLAIADISDGASPRLLASVPLPPVSPFGETCDSPMAMSVKLLDGIALVGTYAAYGAVHGYDVRVPSRPREVSRNIFEGIGLVDALVPDGTRIFVAGGRGITEAEISQPRNVVRTYEAPRSLQK